MRHDRALDETQDEETQGEEDEDEEDEEINEDEVLVEPEDESEFEEVLTEYLDAVDIVEARNELREIPQNIGRPPQGNWYVGIFRLEF